MAALLLGVITGCASPGPPRPPSLHLPRPVRDLSAVRVGDRVELRFTVPQVSTDGLPLREKTLSAAVCREVAGDHCQPVGEGAPRRVVPVKADDGRAETIMVTDALHGPLLAGAPRPLLYRVELYNGAGRSAGASAAVSSLAGASLPAIEALRTEGSRRGVLLGWTPAASDAGEIILVRERLRNSPAAPVPPRPKRKEFGALTAGEEEADTVSFDAHATGSQSPTDAGRTLDVSAVPDTPYTYTAQRRKTVRLTGGAEAEMRSEISPSVPFTLRDTFPPLAPTQVTAAPFGGPAGFAVDLIWEPVDDPGLAGYLVRRETLSAADVPVGPATLLTEVPVTMPSFRDTTASASLRYRYRVEAVDRKGNRSPATTVVVNPTAGM